jgi:hypothetical protein
MAIVVAAIVAARSFGADSAALRQQQQAQAQARALAVELVSAVLDVQLRQLEENSLKSLPIYRDIASMKEHIAALARSDMDKIVELLIEAQTAAPGKQQAAINAARAKIREVVAQLMAERQKLYRRMHIARLSAEARQLIGLETKTYEQTRSLPDQRPDERDRLVLATIEDQADITKVFYQLVAALNDVSTWGGPAAAGAADGLRILRAAQVEPELKRVGQSLEKAEFQQAAAGEQRVLKGLATLLEKLDETQGLVDSDRGAALQFVRELRQRQLAIREQTRQTELNERTTEPLIDQQTRLQKELNKLGLALAKFPLAESQLEQAKAASFEATASLFEEKKASAIEQQDRVAGDLSKIEKALEEGLDSSHANKSAAELLAEISRLEQLQKQLEKAGQEQIAATSAASERPQIAREREAQVAATLAATEKIGPVASAVTLRLDEATEKVAAAEAAMRARDNATAESRKLAADEALTAIRAAQAEVQSQLADTRRWQKAVEVGELARAAEALERAAAAENEVARQAADAGKSGELPAEKAAALMAEQADVAAVAERIAAGVEQMAPQAHRLLRAAAPNVAAAAQALEDARSQAGQAMQSSIAKASHSAEQAAQQLAASADELRRQQGQAASELQNIAGQQLDKTEDARQAVEKASESPLPGWAEALSALQHARQKTSEALIEQLRAAGRSAEADARSLSERVAELNQEQKAADDAAARLARGQSDSPLGAASQEQQVADKAEEIAKHAPQEIAKPLKEAAQSASTAARETLNGAPSKAEQARAQTRAAIRQAEQAAKQMAEQARQSPTSNPDAAAQAKAGAATSEAQRAADAAEKAGGAEVHAANESLRHAAQQATAAGQQLESGDVGQARASQQQAHRSLTEAADHVDKAIRELAAQQAQHLGQLAQRSGELGDLARVSDAGAAAALSQVQKAAQRGAGLAEQPGQLRDADQLARHKLEQATSSLAARAQQLRHDRDMALALAQLAGDQQAARDAITQSAGNLARPVATEADRAAQVAAAQALQQAQQQFAAAQTATGEGAADVSGQQEVANQPIREGLEIASQLSQRLLPKPTEEQAQADDAGADQNKTDRQQNEDSKSAASAKSKAADSKSPFDLGTKMVPKSPQITARQIAGQQANNTAAKAMADALKGKGQPGKNEGESETPMEGASSSTAKKGGAAKGGKSANNQKANKGELETADAADANSRGEPAGQDAAASGRSLESESWFAKLPPSLQSAIQAKSRGKAPRGYEERLRRYFESID